jgi:hypothetical protein
MGERAIPRRRRLGLKKIMRRKKQAAWSIRLGAIALERFPAEWTHSVEKKSLQIQKFEHILIAQIDST